MSRNVTAECKKLYAYEKKDGFLINRKKEYRDKLIKAHRTGGNRNDKQD